jgi:CBS domain-containing protein
MSKTTIREIIGAKRDVYSVDVAQSIRPVIAYMHDKNIGAVAICDGDKVVGVFSERDLLRRVVHEGLDLDTVNLRDVMTSPVYWISMEERYEVAKAIMVDKGIRHLVVLDEQRHLRGFVSSRELVGKLNDDYYEHHFKP